MARTDGSAVLELDFGVLAAAPADWADKGGLRLASSSPLRGQEKYRELERRRRRAQLRARRLLDLMEKE